jgi:hypothetical protein
MARRRKQLADEMVNAVCRNDVKAIRRLLDSGKDVAGNRPLSYRGPLLWWAEQLE